MCYYNQMEGVAGDGGWEETRSSTGQLNPTNWQAVCDTRSAQNTSSWVWQGKQKQNSLRLAHSLLNCGFLFAMGHTLEKGTTEVFRLYFTGVDKSTENKIAANDTHSRCAIVQSLV
jgi:hypothetical protein